MPVTVPHGRVWLNTDEPNDEYPMFAVNPIPKKAAGVVRIWVDGCFDMLHFGHSNALRQAASLGTELFVGSHSDEEVIKYKGPPIMHAHERYDALRACKWVDHVIENYPYVTRLKDIERFEIDYVVHGDDISIDLNGNNSYQEIIDAGKFKVVRRTSGISTTDLVGRMLYRIMQNSPDGQIENDDEFMKEIMGKDMSVRYLTTSNKIAQFSNRSVAKSDDMVVYVDGAFDLFHNGHISLLEQARKLGSYLVVGVHTDDAVKERKGQYPIMNLNERILGVLSCRYVDEVLLGVPFKVTPELIKEYNVKHVVAGIEYQSVAGTDKDPYLHPRQMGILQEMTSKNTLNTEALIQRVMDNRRAFLERQRVKVKKDQKMEGEKPEEYRNVREVA